MKKLVKPLAPIILVVALLGFMSALKYDETLTEAETEAIEEQLGEVAEKREARLASKTE